MPQLVTKMVKELVEAIARKEGLNQKLGGFGLGTAHALAGMASYLCSVHQESS